MMVLIDLGHRIPHLFFFLISPGFCKLNIFVSLLKAKEKIEYSEAEVKRYNRVNELLYPFKIVVNCKKKCWVFRHFHVECTPLGPGFLARKWNLRTDRLDALLRMRENR